MHLMIAGDSFATPGTPKFSGVSELIYDGKSHGEIIAKHCKMSKVTFAGEVGLDICHSVMRAMYYILYSEVPISHIILHVTEFTRLSRRVTDYLHPTDCDREYDLFHKQLQGEKPFFEHMTYDDFERLSRFNSNISTPDFLDQTIMELHFFKQLSTLFVLDQFCKNRNIKLMVLRVTDRGQAPWLRDHTFLDYVHMLVVRDKNVYPETKSVGWDLRPGNHLFPEEHLLLANNLMSAYPEFFNLNQ